MTANKNDSQEYLRAKCDAALELYQAGRITRSEMFRNEVDLSLNQDTGPIQLADIEDQESLMAEYDELNMHKP